MSTETLAPRRPRHVPVKGAPNVYKSLRADGKTWSFEVRHPRNARGQRLFEVVGTRLDLARRRARDVWANSSSGPPTVAITVDEVYKLWVTARQVKPRTEELYDGVYRTHIAPSRIARMKVRAVTKQEIASWLGQLERRDGKPGPLASGTKRLCYSVLRMVLNHASEIDALATVPKLDRRRVPRPSDARTRVISPSEERAILECCGEPLFSMVILALDQALRIGEICGLRWEDIDFITSKVTVRHNLGRDGKLGTTKSGKPRTIDLMPRARQVLRERRLQRPTDDFVFETCVNTAQAAFAKAAKRAGLDGVTFHTLRHTGLSRLANSPAVPLVYVRDFAGHSSLELTQRYMHKIEDANVTAAAAEALTGSVPLVIGHAGPSDASAKPYQSVFRPAPFP